MAAVLASGSDACLSHRSAARIWRLIPPGAEWAEVTSPPPRRARRNGIVCHEGVVAEDEQDVVDEIPVTSPFRTIFDLAAILEPRAVERAFHEAEVQELTDRVSLPMLLERYPGRRGARTLRAVLGSNDPVGITRNDFEEAFLALIDVYGLPRSSLTAAAFTAPRSASRPTGSATASSSPRAGGRCGSPGGSCGRNRRRLLLISALYS
jgi:hypothetical protein